MLSENEHDHENDGSDHALRHKPTNGHSESDEEMNEENTSNENDQRGDSSDEYDEQDDWYEDEEAKKGQVSRKKP